MSLIEKAKLMEQSRADLVKALQDVGFPQVNDKTPLGDIAKYMQWAGGLLDVRLAAISKSDKSTVYFTEDEWTAMSTSKKNGYVGIGVCLRAERRQFIIARSDASDLTSGNTAFKWTESYANVPGVKDYTYGSVGLYDDFEDKANTDKILEYAKSANNPHPAAEVARAYKASSVGDGGLADPTEWHLPALGTLRLIYKYRKAINAALAVFFGTANNIGTSWYWSSSEESSSYAWLVYMYNGVVYNYIKGNPIRVRPVAEGGSSPAISL